MPVKTPSEWVDLIDTAIAAIISGTVSSYSVSGRNFTKHNLPQLQDLRDYWAGIDAERRIGFTTRVDMTRAE